MSLIKNGCAAYIRRGFSGMMLSALLAFVTSASGAAPAQEVKEIKLTEKHVQGFIAAHDDLTKLFDI